MMNSNKGGKRKKKVCVFHPRRHIEDAPFYAFQYDSEDLPLDPAKELILNKIGRFLLSSRFNQCIQNFFPVKLQEDKTVGICNVELNFHKHRTNVEAVLPTEFFDDQVMPERFEMLMDMPNFECEALDFMEFQSNVMDVTDRILSMFRMRKMSILHEDYKTKSPLFLDEYQVDHRGPSDSISSYNSLCARKLRMAAMRKQRKAPIFKRTHEDFYRMRTREECLEELAHMEVVIKDLMEPELKKAKLAGKCPLKPLEKTPSCDKYDLGPSERGGGDADLPKRKSKVGSLDITLECLKPKSMVRGRL